jgi:hypothetical protein
MKENHPPLDYNQEIVDPSLLDKMLYYYYYAPDFFSRVMCCCYT